MFGSGGSAHDWLGWGCLGIVSLNCVLIAWLVRSSRSCREKAECYEVGEDPGDASGSGSASAPCSPGEVSDLAFHFRSSRAVRSLPVGFALFGFGLLHLGICRAMAIVRPPVAVVQRSLTGHRRHMSPNTAIPDHRHSG